MSILLYSLRVVDEEKSIIIYTGSASEMGRNWKLQAGFLVFFFFLTPFLVMYMYGPLVGYQIDTPSGNLLLKIVSSLRKQLQLSPAPKTDYAEGGKSNGSRAHITSPCLLPFDLYRR